MVEEATMTHANVTGIVVGSGERGEGVPGILVNVEGGGWWNSHVS